MDTEIAHGHCCFCFHVTALGAQGDGLRLRVDDAESPWQQELYAHMDCLRTRLHDRVPFEPETYNG